MDGNKACSTGGLRGLGILKPLTLIVFISYYVISPPFEYIYGYLLDLKVIGLWAGQMMGAAYHLGAQLYWLYWKADWDQIAKEANERIERDKSINMKNVIEIGLINL